MKINEHQAILAPRILLVPYCTHHVPTYHSWMQDEEIQKATASSPLTLSEEHAMQQSWRLDHDKLTFIICLAPSPSLSASSPAIKPEIHDTPTTMLGDVNLFLYEDEEEESEVDGMQGKKAVVGEIEIMIAAQSSRRQGFAQEAVRAFLSYISSNISSILEEYRLGSDERSERYIKYLRVKIGQENGASVGLFGKLGFEQVGGVNYFGEVEMRMGWGNVEGLKGEGEGEVVGYGV
ncbi:hypothetical protein HBI56_043320 [Parastagonospora nodorum]|nr:hypothetical protein HBI10_046610 [Parastagonospora nodorum]KAH4031198.1 hypothetical protein HBI13_030070 [Parastagonospora nodorum]KAH4920570.1 hypothetical protein HBI79_192980 [Parastagonospora nodorum]KAH5056096.1 hypothetical protein HBI73_220410 [Parastagonospora nodorum]KAH5195796.1 hypothetical protein HBH76_053650 [Parastagonospora nodorum]